MGQLAVAAADRASCSPQKLDPKVARPLCRRTSQITADPGRQTPTQTRRTEASWALANSGDVNVTKSLWAAVQGDPVFMRRVNGWLAVVWVVMIPISYELGWLKSVAFVSALSLWALVSVCMAGGSRRGAPRGRPGRAGGAPG